MPTPDQGAEPTMDGAEADQEMPGVEGEEGEEEEEMEEDPVVETPDVPCINM